MNIKLIDNWKGATGQVICNDFCQTGSGFFVGDQGIFITNNHVVHKFRIDESGVIRIDYSNQIFIKVNGKTHRASIVFDENSDPPIVYDYAILKTDVTPVYYFDIKDNFKVSQGEEVIAIGYPLEFAEPVVTYGIISAIVLKPSHINSLHRIKTFLTDTLITYGSSGGPLIRVSDGFVIGINTMPHEIKDELRIRLQNYLRQPNIDNMPQIQDLINFVLKYLNIGFNHAISLEFAMSDPVFKSLQSGG